MSENLVVTIIPNWNLKEDLGECLDSLLHTTYSPHQIVVVDNGSTDGSVDFISDNYHQVHLIALSENLGYAGAINHGIEWAKTQGANYYFVLNNDTIVNPEVISQIVEIMDDDNSIGIASPKILHYSDPSKIYSLGTKIYPYFPLPITVGKDHKNTDRYNKIIDFDYVTGCAMMISVNCINKLGLFNTNYFMYYEDSDYCRRARELGFNIICVGYATIFHKGSVSASKNMQQIVNIRAKNRFNFYRKYKHGPSKNLTYIFLWIIAIWVIIKYIIQGKPGLIKPYITGLWQGYREPQKTIS